MMANNNNNNNDNYIEKYLPRSVVEKLEAGAWKNLCDHLRDRSDEVQNIDLMTISGFCRNCLAKWLVVEARTLSDRLKKEEDGVDDSSKSNIIKSLDALGYDEAAQYVYGMDYVDWKKAHSKKATDDQMEKFNNSKPMWATHDKILLSKRSDQPGDIMTINVGGTADGGKATTTTQQQQQLLSNVCCQDVENKSSMASAAPVLDEQPKKKSKTRELPSFVPPIPPESGVSFSLGILTISDRASSGQYETGDLSGPAVLDAIQKYVKDAATEGGGVSMNAYESCIVADDSEAIQSKLSDWSSDGAALDIILTTGGTGFSIRDVTPEATANVVERKCDGLIQFCTMECSKLQPLASLSRGIAGIKGKTLIANLPGNPKGVGEIIPVLLPLALHIISDMKKGSS